MKKKNKQLTQLFILLGVLVIAVIALLIAKSISNSAAAKAEQEAEDAVIHVPTVEDADQLVITNPSGTETYVYSEDASDWQWSEDAEFPLNSSYLTNLVSTLTDLTATVSMIDEEPLDVYGLAEPQYSAAVSNAAGESVTLYIGDENDGSYYARTDIDDTVYLIGTDVYDYLCYSLYDMATCETIPSLNSSNLSELTFSGAVDTVLTEEDVTVTEYSDADDTEGTTTIENHWFTEDGTDITDEQYESEMVSEVIGLTFDGMTAYKADDSDLAAAGLTGDTARMLRVDYTDSDDAAQTFVLVFGNETEDGSAVYVQFNGGDCIYTINTDDIAYLLAMFDEGVSVLSSSMEG